MANTVWKEPCPRNVYWQLDFANFDSCWALHRFTVVLWTLYVAGFSDVITDVRAANEFDGHLHPFSVGVGKHTTEEHGLYDGDAKFVAIIDSADDSRLGFDSARDRVASRLFYTVSTVVAGGCAVIVVSDERQPVLLSAACSLAGEIVTSSRKGDSENRYF